MTSEEHWERFVALFPQCPNPEHSPITFQYYLKLYKYFYLNKSGDKND